MSSALFNKVTLKLLVWLLLFNNLRARSRLQLDFYFPKVYDSFRKTSTFWQHKQPKKSLNLQSWLFYCIVEEKRRIIYMLNRSNWDLKWQLGVTRSELLNQCGLVYKLFKNCLNIQNFIFIKFVSINFHQKRYEFSMTL